MSTNQHETTIEQERPWRPLGVSLAIFASVMIFTVLPLVQLGFELYIQSQFTLDFSEFTDETGEPVPVISGGDVIVSDGRLITTVVISCTFFAIAVLAWIGQPPWIRFVLFGAVIGLTLLSVLASIQALLSPPDLSSGLSSADSFSSIAQCGQLVVTLLIALYVVWYMNRAPARAFYRGYYLQDEKPDV